MALMVGAMTIHGIVPGPQVMTKQPELFWGLRGAGANFGVATSLELELHPFSGTLHRGVHVHTASDIHDLWAVFREFAAAAPDTVAAIFTVALAEPAGPAAAKADRQIGDPVSR